MKGEEEGEGNGDGEGEGLQMSEEILSSGSHRNMEKLS